MILKGGALLAAYGARRPTRDIDLQARSVQADIEQVKVLVAGIAAFDLDDGLVFDTAAATAHTIRDDDQYSGVRVGVAGTLANARLSLHVDVNVGDPIWPAPSAVDVPRLLGCTITVVGYPLSMVLAEKIVTAVQRGTANTRWRDFADIYLLTRHHRIAGDDLRGSLNEVAAYRRVRLHRWPRSWSATPRWANRDGRRGIDAAGWALASRLRSASWSMRWSASPTRCCWGHRFRMPGIPRLIAGADADRVTAARPRSARSSDLVVDDLSTSKWSSQVNLRSVGNAVDDVLAPGVSLRPGPGRAPPAHDRLPRPGHAPVARIRSRRAVRPAGSSRWRRRRRPRSGRRRGSGWSRR